MKKFLDWWAFYRPGFPKGVLSDRELIRLGRKLIRPFTPTLISHTTGDINGKILSYGVGSFGYDIRLDMSSFKIFTHQPGEIVNPKNFNDQFLKEASLFSDGDGGVFYVLPGLSYALGVATERISLPDNITVICMGKSTYARCGISVNITPAEAGWEGFLTLEICNNSNADCRIYANEGICQLIFFRGDRCKTSYQTRKGKYQRQPKEIVTAR